MHRYFALAAPIVLIAGVALSHPGQSIPIGPGPGLAQASGGSMNNPRAAKLAITTPAAGNRPSLSSRRACAPRSRRLAALA